MQSLTVIRGILMQRSSLCNIGVVFAVVEAPNASCNVKINLSVVDIYAPHDMLMPSWRRIFVMLAFTAARVSTTDWNVASTSMSSALASFDGGKFMFSHSPGLYVCEKNVQQQAAAVPASLLLSAAMVHVLLGSLDDICVRAFGVHSTDFDLSPVYRSTTFTPYGECVVYLFSPSYVYCVRRSDGRATQLDLPATIGPAFALFDVAVYNTSLIVTYARQEGVSSAVFPLDGAQGVTALSGIGGLLMFAQGRPDFCLILACDGSCLYLRQLDCGGRALPDITCVSNDVYQIFSSRVQLSSRNTLLDGSGSQNFVVFATAVFAPGSDGRMSVFVYVSTVDLARFTGPSSAMPHRVYRLTQTREPELYSDELYEAIDAAGEAVLSAAWWNDTTLVLGVAVESDGLLLQFPKFAVSVDSLALSAAQLSDVLYSVQAPFLRVSGALFSAGRLHTCMSCVPTAAGRGTSGFFAFGVSQVELRRLLPCSMPDTYVDESTWGAAPVKTCAALANTTELAARVPEFVLALKCVKVGLEVVLALAAGARLAFAMTFPYEAGSPRRVLLQVTCGNNFAALYDEFLCSNGCSVRIRDATFVLSGGVDIESVRSVPRSGVWRRRLALTSSATSRELDAQKLAPGALAAGVWQDHALVVQSIRSRQPIFVHVRRDVSLSKLVQDMSIDQEPVTKVALDVLSVTPVLSQPATRLATGLVTVVYVPSAANLSALELAPLASGDDLSNWQRVHAAVRLATTDQKLAGCEYAARLVAVNDSLWPIADLLPVGCALTLPVFAGHAVLQVQCHIELPLKLGNNGSFVGLELRAAACELPEARALTVELVPFMPISECPAFFFLHAVTRSCVACAAERCDPGFYVGGCAELMHPSRPVACLACSAPLDSRFPNTSSGCTAWVCRDGFFQANASACVPCTAVLNCSSLQPGTRRAACSSTQNERCVPCSDPPLPRYALWTNASQECVWRCGDGYFVSNGGCERCDTLADLRMRLDGQGLRAAGGFYRFRQCTVSQQAAFWPCSVSDFSYRLNGTYAADALEFETDCALQCTAHDRLHLVKMALSDATGAAWDAQTCIECALWPTFANGSRLPLGAFEMSAACEPSCVSAAAFFPGNATSVCLWCPRAACPVGSFWTRSDNCTRCKPCTAQIQGANFTGNGAIDDAASCPEQCPVGSFLYDSSTCREHSATPCVAGLEYRVAGTHTADAECRTCSVCRGRRQTRACNATGNTECESCGFLDDWNSVWSDAGCELQCKLGYTRLHTAAGQVCKKCWPCPRGTKLPDTPSTCDCLPCSVVLPQGAFYTDGCTYRCPLYHIELHGACQYALRHASNEVYRPVQVSSVVCSYGQRIVQGTGQDSYRLFSCQDCDVPAGLNATDLNATWVWAAGCVWKCTGNLMKFDRQGTYGCAPYYVRRVSAPPDVIVGWSSSDLAALFGSLVVLLLFSLCLLHRFLAPSGESEDDEPLVRSDVDVEQSQQTAQPHKGGV